jgi:hypothetical protein
MDVLLADAVKISKCIDNIEALREWKKQNFSVPLPNNISKDILNFYKYQDTSDWIEDCIWQIKEYGSYIM